MSTPFLNNSSVLQDKETFMHVLSKLTPTESIGVFKILNWNNNETYRMVLENEFMYKVFLKIPDLKEKFGISIFETFWNIGAKRGKNDFILEMLRLGIIPDNSNAACYESLSCLNNVVFKKVMNGLEKEKPNIFKNTQFILNALENNYFVYLEKEKILTEKFFVENFENILKTCIRISSEHKKYTEKTQNKLSDENQVWDNFCILLNQYKNSLSMVSIENIYNQANSLCNCSDFKKKFSLIDDILSNVHIEKSQLGDFKKLSSQPASIALSQEVGYKMIYHYNLFEKNFDVIHSWAKVSFWKNYPDEQVKALSLDKLYSCYFKKKDYLEKLISKNPKGVFEEQEEQCKILTEKISLNTQIDQNSIQEILKKSTSSAEFNSLIEAKKLALISENKKENIRSVL